MSIVEAMAAIHWHESQRIFRFSTSVDYMEGTTRINRCLEPDHFCSRNGTETCPVRKYYEELQSKFDETLHSVTIAKLAEGCS